jgi:hypothetical protein
MDPQSEYDIEIGTEIRSSHCAPGHHRPPGVFDRLIWRCGHKRYSKQKRKFNPASFGPRRGGPLDLRLVQYEEERRRLKAETRHGDKLLNDRVQRCKMLWMRSKHRRDHLKGRAGEIGTNETATPRAPVGACVEDEFESRGLIMRRYKKESNGLRFRLSRR